MTAKLNKEKKIRTFIMYNKGAEKGFNTNQTLAVNRDRDQRKPSRSLGKFLLGLE